MKNINYWSAVGTAWNRMVAILFQPFNMEKWFVMGFAAWIAGLNSGGGGGSGGNGFSSTNSSSGNSGSSGCGPQFSQFWSEYGPLIIVLLTLLITVIVILIIVFSWLHARGKFIFLDNVLYNRPAIVAPWKKYRRQGNSLFLWNVAIGLIGLLFILLCGALCLPLIIPLVSGGEAVAIGVLSVIIALILLIFYSIVISFMQMLVYDFVMLLMLKYDLRIREAWHRFSEILRPSFGQFVVYALVRYLLSIIISCAVLAVGLATCCCLFFIAAIPYLGTVLMLPVFVFIRLIGIEFLRQFGEDLNDLVEQPEEAAPALP